MDRPDVEGDLHMLLLKLAQGEGLKVPWLYGGNSRKIVAQISALFEGIRKQNDFYEIDGKWIHIKRIKGIIYIDGLDIVAEAKREERDNWRQKCEDLIAARHEISTREERERIKKIVFKVAKDREENLGSQRGWVTDFMEALKEGK